MLFHVLLDPEVLTEVKSEIDALTSASLSNVVLDLGHLYQLMRKLRFLNSQSVCHPCLVLPCFVQVTSVAGTYLQSSSYLGNYYIVYLLYRRYTGFSTKNLWNLSVSNFIDVILDYSQEVKGLGYSLMGPSIHLLLAADLIRTLFCLKFLKLIR